MVRYKMVAKDVNSIPAHYRTWVVGDFPDYGVHYYTGLKSGDAPFVDVSGYEIQDDNAVVDFSLPHPTRWHAVKASLPQAVMDSQLAIIDGYAYLFGGAASDKIFKADINRPAEWVDTGAVLRTPLSGSQLAIVDDRVYLFGGRNEETVDTIFSASLDNPLDWTNHGSLLPETRHQSQLAIIGDYIYLFGGQGLNIAQADIWRAPLTDPLSWVDTGADLPIFLYGSVIAIMGTRVFLLGGLLGDDSPTKNIYAADLIDPLFWGLAGNLPFAACYGQFITIGQYGYLYTQAAVTGPQPYLTRIFRCQKDYPANWVDMIATLPADLTQSQFGIIDDRVYAFGANGMSALFASDQVVKYEVGDSRAVSYGSATRIQFKAATNSADKIRVLGFPYWKTNYAP